MTAPVPHPVTLPSFGEKVARLRERYLRPWAQQALAMLGERPALLALVEQLAADIESA